MGVWEPNLQNQRLGVRGGGSSPQSASQLSFSIPLVCTVERRVAAREEIEDDDLIKEIEDAI